MSSSPPGRRMEWSASNLTITPEIPHTNLSGPSAAVRDSATPTASSERRVPPIDLYGSQVGGGAFSHVRAGACAASRLTSSGSSGERSVGGLADFAAASILGNEVQSVLQASGTGGGQPSSAGSTSARSRGSREPTPQQEFVKNLFEKVAAQMADQYAEQSGSGKRNEGPASQQSAKSAPLIESVAEERHSATIASPKDSHANSMTTFLRTDAANAAGPRAITTPSVSTGGKPAQLLSSWTLTTDRSNNPLGSQSFLPTSQSILSHSQQRPPPSATSGGSSGGSGGSKVPSTPSSGGARRSLSDEENDVPLLASSASFGVSPLAALNQIEQTNVGESNSPPLWLRQLVAEREQKLREMQQRKQAINEQRLGAQQQQQPKERPPQSPTQGLPAAVSNAAGSAPGYQIDRDSQSTTMQSSLPPPSASVCTALGGTMMGGGGGGSNSNGGGSRLASEIISGVATPHDSQRQTSVDSNSMTQRTQTYQTSDPSRSQRTEAAESGDADGGVVALSAANLERITKEGGGSVDTVEPSRSRHDVGGNASGDQKAELETSALKSTDTDTRTDRVEISESTASKSPVMSVSMNSIPGTEQVTPGASQSQPPPKKVVVVTPKSAKVSRGSVGTDSSSALEISGRSSVSPTEERGPSAAGNPLNGGGPLDPLAQSNMTDLFVDALSTSIRGRLVGQQQQRTTSAPPSPSSGALGTKESVAPPAAVAAPSASSPLVAAQKPPTADPIASSLRLLEPKQQVVKLVRRHTAQNSASGGVHEEQAPMSRRVLFPQHPFSLPTPNADFVRRPESEPPKRRQQAQTVVVAAHHPSPREDSPPRGHAASGLNDSELYSVGTDAVQRAVMMLMAPGPRNATEVQRQQRPADPPSSQPPPPPKARVSEEVAAKVHTATETSDGIVNSPKLPPPVQQEMTAARDLQLEQPPPPGQNDNCRPTNDDDEEQLAQRSGRSATPPPKRSSSGHHNHPVRRAGPHLPHYMLPTESWEHHVDDSPRHVHPSIDDELIDRYDAHHPHHQHHPHPEHSRSHNASREWNKNDDDNDHDRAAAEPAQESAPNAGQRTRGRSPTPKAKSSPIVPPRHSPRRAQRVSPAAQQARAHVHHEEPPRRRKPAASASRRDSAVTHAGSVSVHRTQRDGDRDAFGRLSNRAEAARALRLVNHHEGGGGAKAGDSAFRESLRASAPSLAVVEPDVALFNRHAEALLKKQSPVSDQERGKSQHQDALRRIMAI